MFGVISNQIQETYDGIQLNHIENHANHYCLDNGERDTMGICLKSAILYAEKMTRLTIHKRLITIVGAAFPSCGIRLNASPVQSIQGITYKDVNGDEQSYTTYQLDRHKMPYVLLPNPRTVFPSTESENCNAVTVQYVAGFKGNSSLSMPDDLVIAIRQLAATYWANREHLGEITSLRFEIPSSMKSIFLTHKVMNSV